MKSLNHETNKLNGLASSAERKDILAETVHPLEIQELAVEVEMAVAEIDLVLNVVKKAISREIALRQEILQSVSSINLLPALTSLSKDLTRELLLEVGAKLLEQKKLMPVAGVTHLPKLQMELILGATP